MTIKRILLVATTLAAITAGAVLAAQSSQPSMQHMPQHYGMMGQEKGQAGSSGMMGCPMMSGGMSGGMGGHMGGMMMGGRALPAFPAGNEKLQLQMQAEIMQKVGEIMAKYAAQLPAR